MKSKSLKAIQTLVKIGRIISKIIFIFSIVGAAGCVLGIISLALVPGDFRVGEMTLRELIETKSGVSFGTMYTSMAAGIVPCAGEAVLAKLAERCLKRELDAGTPFTFAGAKDLITLGICAVCITVGTAITAGIVTGIMKNFFENVEELEINGFQSAWTGVLLIVGGLLCGHGAEASERPTEPEGPALEEQKDPEGNGTFLC